MALLEKLKKISIVSSLSPQMYQGVGLTNNLSGAPGVNLTIQGVFDILVRMTCWGSRMALLVIVISLVYYAIMYFKGQGSPQSIGEANGAFKWGLIGSIVVFGVYTIIKSV